MSRLLCLVLTISPIFWLAPRELVAQRSSAASKDVVREAMKRAATYYFENVSTHGGYVYFYSLDLQRRLGEGVASPDQIWVQPPGTPTVGMAYLAAWCATQDEYYLKAATAAAEAIAYGQVQSGGWTNCIDFNPQGDRASLYKNGKGRGRNTSSLDDGQTQSAIRLLVLADEALHFRNLQIHEAAITSLDALLAEQFPNGAFPQVWDGDQNPDPPIQNANYPSYDWRTEGRIKNYWDYYTLNDNVCGYLVQTLMDAHRVYGDERYKMAIEQLGNFLIRAQMPDPQAGWAQQYNYDMQPIWARKFEPPGVSGDESQEAIETLLKIHAFTGDDKYLEPIPKALAYLKKSLLPDNQLARYYELKTNRPLYMERRGDVYSLTYSDANLPDHYGWKTPSRLPDLERQYELQRNGRTEPKDQSPPAREVQEIIRSLDQQGRWISTYTGERLIGQAKFPRGDKYLSSELFSQNLTSLAGFLNSLK
ncbi:MAG: pectic acid lyase [Planctomycetaceae bacterium]|nr:pectic acid lyase [Planctomycetaceae bacterium]